MQKKIFTAVLGLAIFAGAMTVSTNSQNRSIKGSITKVKAAPGDPIACFRACRFNCVIDGTRYWFFRASPETER